MNNDNSSTNTVLIVVILLILVGLGVWWFAGRGPAAAPQEIPDRNDASLNIDLQAPADNGSDGSNPNNP